MLEEIINTIENEDLKELANELIKTIPDYWYHVGASSTGKYHPAYALGEGGLMRHTIALCKIMNYIMSVVPICENSRERDLLRIAGIMHDTRKSGSQEDYDRSKYTKFDHPYLAEEVVLGFKGKRWKDVEIDLIANSIASHMGQWNTDKRSNVKLPLPKTKYQYLLHVSDYLASRKDLEVKFENFTLEEIKAMSPTLEKYIVKFGKHSGKTLPEIQKYDPSYIVWAKKNIDREPIKTLLTQL